MFGAMIFAFLMSLLPLVALSCLFLIPSYIIYKNSNYRLASGNSFIRTVFDKGNYGEFLTYVKLEKLDCYKRLLTNLYIPKKDGTTTEIDLLMLTHTGIYVFESKNYSGWIFGDEKQRYWTQTLQNGRKNKFFNPIWQNKGHITALQDVLSSVEEHLFKSLIIFSKRCTLKKVTVSTPTIHVLKRNDLMRFIKKEINGTPLLLRTDQIDELYETLSAYFTLEQEVKDRHIETITSKK